MIGGSHKFRPNIVDGLFAFEHHVSPTPIIVDDISWCCWIYCRDLFYNTISIIIRAWIHLRGLILFPPFLFLLFSYWNLCQSILTIFLKFHYSQTRYLLNHAILPKLFLHVLLCHFFSNSANLKIILVFQINLKTMMTLR
jgi:hypothetical protein